MDSEQSDSAAWATVANNALQVCGVLVLIAMCGRCWGCL